MVKLFTLRFLSDLAERLKIGAAAGRTFAGLRDMYKVLGYSVTLGPDDYTFRYERGGIAETIVETFPKATWRGGAELIEDEDPDTETELERVWSELADRLHVWNTFLRADILAGLGRYAVLLIGAPGPLDQELGKFSADKLAYLSAFGERDVKIASSVTDSQSERFGQPAMYNVTINGTSRSVHWSRVIHIAEDSLDSGGVYGKPRLRAVWNRLDDLEKVTGGGAEAFWLRANQGYHLDLDPDLDVDADDVTDLRDKMEELAHQMRRTIGTQGAKIKALGSDVAEFGQSADALMTQIAGITRIPKRILTGSEQGELASSQDRTNWDVRVGDRREQFADPVITRPLIQRLIDYGVLPTPKAKQDYAVRWPEIRNATDAERAELAMKLAEANSKQGEDIVLTQEIRDRVLLYPPIEEVLSPEELAKLEEEENAPPPIPPGPGDAGTDTEQNADPDADPEVPPQARQNRRSRYSRRVMRRARLKAAKQGRLWQVTWQ